MKIMVKKKFFFNDNGNLIPFTPGVHEVPDRIGTHPWAKEHSEEFILEEAKETKEPKPKKTVKESE